MNDQTCKPVEFATKAAMIEALRPLFHAGLIGAYRAVIDGERIFADVWFDGSFDLMSEGHLIAATERLS